MGGDARRVATAEQRERFNAARTAGGLCAACGRSLGDDEPVYIEQMMVDLNSLAAPGGRWSRNVVRRDAPLGRECASPAFVARTAGRTPEACAGCGRPMYYAKDRTARRRAICSRDCRNRADAAARSPRTGGRR